MAQEDSLTVSIKGKAPDLFSRLYEYNPAQVRANIATFFGVSHDAKAVPDLSDVPEIPQRPPTLCAGCSHRATFYEVRKAAEGMETIYPTDIGCYTLGLLPPLSSADFLICMGSSVGTSGGFSKVTDKKVIAFIGDSTFFHSGIPGLINAVFNNHNFTLVILDNGTTAMTGHQPHPGVDMQQIGLDGYGQSLHRGCRAGRWRPPCNDDQAIQGQEEHRCDPRGHRIQRRFGHYFGRSMCTVCPGTQTSAAKTLRSDRQVQGSPGLHGLSCLPGFLCLERTNKNRPESMHRMRCLRADLSGECHFASEKKEGHGIVFVTESHLFIEGRALWIPND